MTPNDVDPELVAAIDALSPRAQAAFARTVEQYGEDVAQLLDVFVRDGVPLSSLVEFSDWTLERFLEDVERLERLDG